MVYSFRRVPLTNKYELFFIPSRICWTWRGYPLICDIINSWVSCNKSPEKCYEKAHNESNTKNIIFVRSDNCMPQVCVLRQRKRIHHLTYVFHNIPQNTIVCFLLVFLYIVSNHRCADCLLNRLLRRRSKKTPKLRVTDLCEGNQPVTGGFPSQRVSNAENAFIWWRHHFYLFCWVIIFLYTHSNQDSFTGAVENLWVSPHQ